jgi:hypothetical protein
MKLNRNTQKGQIGTNALWIVLVVILVIVGMKYYHDHNDDIVIHPPHIDVH